MHELQNILIEEVKLLVIESETVTILWSASA